jgi:hypothetical protein
MHHLIVIEALITITIIQDQISLIAEDLLTRTTTTIHQDLLDQILILAITDQQEPIEDRTQTQTIPTPLETIATLLLAQVAVAVVVVAAAVAEEAVAVVDEGNNLTNLCIYTCITNT